MSQLVRRVALVPLLGFLAWKPAPVQAGSCDCEIQVEDPPAYGLICADCFAGQVCAEEWQCYYAACEPYEAGAYVGLWCS